MCTIVSEVNSHILQTGVSDLSPNWHQIVDIWDWDHFLVLFDWQIEREIERGYVIIGVEETFMTTIYSNS